MSARTAFSDNIRKTCCAYSILCPHPPNNYSYHRTGTEGDKVSQQAVSNRYSCHQIGILKLSFYVWGRKTWKVVSNNKLIRNDKTKTPPSPNFGASHKKLYVSQNFWDFAILWEGATYNVSQKFLAFHNVCIYYIYYKWKKKKNHEIFWK